MHPTLIKFAAAVVGSLIGACGGGVTAIAAGMLAGLVAQLLYPNDPSAGSAAEIVILLIPIATLLGVIAGAIAGWRFAARRQANHS